MVRVTWSQTFIDLIFLMQVSLRNKKSFGKWAKIWLQVTHTMLLTWTTSIILHTHFSYFLLRYSSYFYDSEEQCMSERTIKNKLPVRFELTFPFALGKPGSWYHLFYHVSYKKNDITEVWIKSINQSNIHIQSVVWFLFNGISISMNYSMLVEEQQ